MLFRSPLWSLLTAFSGITDEQQRVRLTATGLPSVVPCTLSGAAMLEESGPSWTAIAQKDGQSLSDRDLEAIVQDSGELFQLAVDHGAPTLVGNGERSGLDSSTSELAPAYPTAGNALAPLKARAEAAGANDFSSLWSGQAASLGREIGAGDLTRELAADAEKRRKALA